MGNPFSPNDTWNMAPVKTGIISNPLPDPSAPKLSMNHSSPELPLTGAESSSSMEIENQIECRISSSNTHLESPNALPGETIRNMSSTTSDRTYNALPTTSTMPSETRLSSSPNNSSSMRPINSLSSETRASNEMASRQRPKHWHLLNMKKEVDRRKSFERWPVSFMDPHRLAAAGFYYTCQEDIVRCPFCGVEVGCWEEGDDPFRDHQRWSPGCGFLRGLPVGNVPLLPNSVNGTVSTDEASRSYDVCGMYTSLEIRPFATPERAGLSNGVKHPGILTIEDLEKHGINQSRGPAHPHYNTYEARLQSYESWPRSLKQKPEKLSEAGFYYTGKGDQTVCFHCGGGLKDWEENDDPWEEHAAWFSKCTHVVLIKGRDFIEEVKRKKENQKQEVTETTKPAADPEPPVSCPSTSGEQVKSEDNGGTSRALDDARLCQICFTEERGVLFLPCGHIVACVKCAPSLSTCAVCRQPFTGTVRAFLS